MKIIVAMDSFKGSCTAGEAGESIARGLSRALPNAEILNIPVADGGEGTTAAIIGEGRGTWTDVSVRGPLGDRAAAGFGTLRSGSCIMEMSAASGLLLVDAAKRDPLRASTYGTGELIATALDRGHRQILIGLGGSATNDGGAGMAQALGARLLDKHGNELPQGGAALINLHMIDLSHFDPRIRECKITCAIDVTNPLCGDNGASAIFGPQKGATPEMVIQLDKALSRYADVIKDQLGMDVKNVPGAGAAGGLGAGFLALCNARFQSGIQAVLDIVDFDNRAADAAFAITGEGRMDGQTLSGKVPIGVAARAKAINGMPVFALCGGLGAGYEATYQHGIDAAYSIVNAPMTLDTACANVEILLEQSAFALGRTYSAFNKN